MKYFYLFLFPFFIFQNSASAKTLVVNDPTAFTATTISDVQIDLSWTLNLASDSVLLVYNTTSTFGAPTDGIMYDAGNTIAGGGTVLYKGIGTSFNHTLLTQNTTYYYKIFSFSTGWIYSAGVTANAKTRCTAFAPNIDEGFENGGVIPVCWTSEIISGSLNWTFTNGNPYSYYQPTSAFEGSYCAFLGSNSTAHNGYKARLVSPPVDMTLGVGPATLGFWACIPSSDVLKVYYKTSYTGSWILLATADSYYGNWKHYLLTLPDLSSDYYIAFEGTRNNVAKSGIGIDKVFINRTGCSLPSLSSISGSTTVCIPSTGSWSVPAVSGCTYLWSVSNGLQVSSTLSASNSFSAQLFGAGHNTVCCTPLNACGYGATICVDVCSDPGPPFATITGPISPCVGTTQTYSVPPAAAYYSFTWTVPAGWIINSGNGTRSITVTVGATPGNVSLFMSGSMCVTPPCGFSNMFNLFVTPITVPAQPSAITGIINPCVGTSKTYSVTNVSGTTYTWSFPSGWNQTAGGTTYTVTATVGSGSGNITVTPSNTCGAGTPRTLTVSPIPLPLQPSVISGNTSPCPGTSQWYYVTEVSGVGYSWSLPSGWTQIAGGNDSIQVTVGTSNCSISVTPSNSCGNGPSRSLAVTAPSSAEAQISIAANPGNNICSGSPVTFNATPVNGGASPVYEWQVNGITAGTNSNTFSSNSLLNGDIVSCIITSNAPCTLKPKDTSNVISMIVQSPLPVSVIVAESVNNICPGTSVVFTATSVNGGTTPVYQWYNNATVVGTNNSTYTSSSLSNGDNIYCIVTSALSCISGSPATSNTITMQMNPVYSFAENHAICDGDVYSWQGSTYNIDGIYTANYTSVLGCDSSYTLTLHTNPSYHFSEIQFLCTGGTYIWHGQTLISTGTYHDNNVSIYGCDSSYTIILKSAEVYSYDSTHQICSGDVYMWHGQNLNTAGTYYDNHVSVFGCDSSYSLTLAVNPSFAYTETHSICDGDFYTWHGQSLIATGTYYDNQTSINGCDSTYTLTLNVNPVYAYTVYDTICAGDTLTWQGIDYSTAGIFNAVYSSLNSCDSTYTLNLYLHSLPVVSFSGLNNFYCVYDPAATLTGSPAGGIFSGAGIAGNTFDPNAAGAGTFDIIYSYTDGNDCEKSDTNTVVVDLCIGIMQNNNEGDISIYPNPSFGLVTVEMRNTMMDSKFELLDAIGKLILKGSFNGKTTIDISANGKGMYMLRVISGDKTYNAKLILQ